MITLPIELSELEKIFLDPLVLDQPLAVRMKTEGKLKRNYTKNLASKVYDLELQYGARSVAFDVCLGLRAASPPLDEWNAQFKDAYLIAPQGVPLLHSWLFSDKDRFIEFLEEARRRGVLLLPLFEPSSQRVLVHEGSFTFIVCSPTGSTLELARNPFVKKKAIDTFPKVLKNISVTPSLDLPDGLVKAPEIYTVTETGGLLFFQLKEMFFSHYTLHSDELSKEQARQRETGFYFSRWSVESLYQLLFSKIDRDFFEGHDFLERSVALYILKLAAIGDRQAAAKVEEIYHSEIAWMAGLFHRKFPEKTFEDLKVTAVHIFRNLICGETHADYLKKLYQAGELNREKTAHEKLVLMNTQCLQKIAEKGEAETFEEPADIIFDDAMNKELYPPNAFDVDFRSWMFGPKGRPIKGRLYRRIEKFMRREFRKEQKIKKKTLARGFQIDLPNEEKKLDFIEFDRIKKIWSALQERKPETYKAWYLRRREERSQKEVAELLGIKLSAVKKRVFEGDAFIREHSPRVVNSE